jgi:hypothetical protein
MVVRLYGHAFGLADELPGLVNLEDEAGEDARTFLIAVAERGALCPLIDSPGIPPAASQSGPP